MYIKVSFILTTPFALKFRFNTFDSYISFTFNL